MLTPLEAFMGLWLVVVPLWNGLVPAAATTTPTAVETASSPAPLLALSDDELKERIAADPAALGSLSIGGPGSGMLMNAIALQGGPRWEIPPTAAAWGTAETLAAIQAAVDTVYELFPDTQPIVIGDISDSDGGQLKRHEAHQVGRDVDFGFYYKTRQGLGFATGTAANMDLPRNWALLRALVTRTDVDTILLDTRIQRLLYKYALGIGEDKAWLDRVFQVGRGSRNAIVCHYPLHRNHYHVRFYNPLAQELGRRAHPLLVQLKIIDPPVFTVRHVVRPGQTLGHLATRYRTSVRAIMQANGLRSTMIRAGRSYKIPVRGVAPATQPLVLPQRLLPPTTPDVIASVAWPTIESLHATGSDR